MIRRKVSLLLAILMVINPVISSIAIVETN